MIKMRLSVGNDGKKTLRLLSLVSVISFLIQSFEQFCYAEDYHDPSSYLSSLEIPSTLILSANGLRTNLHNNDLIFFSRRTLCLKTYFKEYTKCINLDFRSYSWIHFLRLFHKVCPTPNFQLLGVRKSSKNVSPHFSTFPWSFKILLLCFLSRYL